MLQSAIQFIATPERLLVIMLVVGIISYRFGQEGEARRIAKTSRHNIGLGNH